MRIGILGGTFDPPHMGHVWLAETAKEQLNLNTVLFVPVGDPPHKGHLHITDLSHRLAMTELAIASNRGFVIDDSDIKRPPPHATVSLLPLIQEKYPQAELWLILGADSLRDFHKWIEPQKIVGQCQLGVLDRPGVVVDWSILESVVPAIRTAVTLLSGPTVSISSTDVRAWVRLGKSIHYLVDTAVETYIKQHNIYNIQPE